MSQPVAREDMLLKGIGAFLLIVVAGVVAWVGITVVSMSSTLAEMNVKLSMLMEKSREIVPREENQRRWEGIEKTTSQNADRISKIEQYLMNRK